MRRQRKKQVYFNSRPSARGDLTPFSADKNTNLFQFTPLREGRQAIDARREALADISIHAPPRGATEEQDGGKA